MMTESKSADVSAPEGVERGTLCAKCDHLNPSGSNVCSRCGAHLHVTCHHCGHRNQRVLARCTHCGEHLHRSFWRRWRKKLFPSRSKVKPWHLALLVAAVILAYKIIQRLAEISLP